MQMRRKDFLQALLALGAASALPAQAAGENIRMMIPANPGGGWDSTGRALGAALQQAGAATVAYENKGGAAGTIGLAQFVGANKGAADSLMVMGAVMLGGIITGNPPVSLNQATPIARLTSEYNVFVVPTSSPFKSMKDVVEALKKDPASVKWAGGSRGSTEHIAAAMLARDVNVDPSKINYIAFRGGGEAIAAILGGNASVGGSGYSEFAEHIAAGKMRPIAVTAPSRIKGIDVPTMKEQGFKVEIGNWRGVYAPPGLSPAQVAALTNLVVAATKSKSWQEAIEKNKWTPALLTGPAFAKFVDDEFASLRAVMVKSGMV